MRKCLQVISKVTSDACSWYRVHGPLSDVERQLRDEWEYHIQKEDKACDWQDQAYFEALFIFRPSGKNSLAQIDVAKIINKKVWLDFDDDLFNIPLANPCFEHYSDPKIREDIIKCIKAADIITVSTECLKKAYVNHNKNVHVVPNAFDDRLIRFRGPRFDKETKTILWRGSATHDEDMLEYLPAMIEISKKHKDWKFIFMGKPSFVVLNKMPYGSYVRPPAVPLPQFWRVLDQVRPSIGIVPLVQSPFNMSKSNIAWQEFSFAGAASVVPNMPEWQRPGASMYSDVDSFFNAVDWLINNKAERERAAQMSWEYIQKNESLSIVNTKRIELLRSLA